MNDELTMDGGCQCGTVRYRVAGAPFAAESCHCRMCQKLAGAMAVCWMDFKVEQVSWMGAEPSEYRSSEHCRRGFCRDCGSSLSFRDARYPEYCTLTIASLDNPNQVKPTYHIYAESQVEWLKIDDDCKRFARDREPDPEP